MVTRQVWQLRVKVAVIDHEGNLADVCVFAALAGLAHFRRPFVALTGDKITIVRGGFVS